MGSVPPGGSSMMSCALAPPCERHIQFVDAGDKVRVAIIHGRDPRRLVGVAGHRIIVGVLLYCDFTLERQCAVRARNTRCRWSGRDR